MADEVGTLELELQNPGVSRSAGARVPDEVAE